MNPDFIKKNRIMCYMIEVSKIVSVLATATADCCDGVSQEKAIIPHLTKIKNATNSAAYYAGLYFEEKLQIKPEHDYSVDYPVEMLFDVTGNLLGLGSEEVDSGNMDTHFNDCKQVKVRALELNLQLILAIANGWNE